MRDDNELAGLTKLGKNLQQSTQVGVVQGRLHLVHDVKGRGARLEDRHQQSHGGQGALSAREQREPLDLLACRTRLDLDSGGEHVVGVGEHQTPLPTREESVEDGGEDLLDASIDLLDDAQQVVP